MSEMVKLFQNNMPWWFVAMVIVLIWLAKTILGPAIVEMLPKPTAAQLKRWIDVGIVPLHLAVAVASILWLLLLTDVWPAGEPTSGGLGRTFGYARQIFYVAIGPVFALVAGDQIFYRRAVQFMVVLLWALIGAMFIRAAHVLTINLDLVASVYSISSIYFTFACIIAAALLSLRWAWSRSPP